MGQTLAMYLGSSQVREGTLTVETCFISHDRLLFVAVVESVVDCAGSKPPQDEEREYNMRQLHRFYRGESTQEQLQLKDAL